MKVMSQTDKIEQRIIEMVNTANDHRQRPHTLVKVLSDELGISTFRVKKVLEHLIGEKKLVFTYRNHCCYVEIPCDQKPSGFRPLKVIVNGKGEPWICNNDVEPSKDLAEQGCWQFSDEGSSRND
jgi:hypothetical protein